MSEARVGPLDEADVDWSDGVERVDLGGLLIPTKAGVDVQVQVDEQTGAIALVSLVIQGAAVQVQPYAAPKSGGMWDDVRPQIAASISSAGGLVEEAQGVFGTELRAQVHGEGGLQPARFVGVEGPRWFLRLVFVGLAARPGAEADALEAAVRSVVVVRGADAMPVGSPIPLRLPQAPGEPATSDPSLNPFVRGPEITETR